MAFDRPVQAPETADGATAGAVAVPVAPGTAEHGGLAQTSPPTGVCMGFLCRGMASDLQVELGIRSGFGQQPYPVPEPPPVPQPPQPGDAVADYAYGPYRLLWATAVSGRQRPGRRSQAAGGDPPGIGVSTLAP